MTCWRCGKSISFGSECDECLAESNKFIPANESPNYKPRPKNEKWVSIDWSKVKTVEDIKWILSCINIKVRKDDKDPLYIKLKGYLLE